MPPHGTEIASFRDAAMLATLRRCRMFADLPADDIKAIAAGCTLKSLAKGEALFREGEKAAGFYVAHAGRISIFRLTPDGREQIICIFEPPESFAEVVLATVETYPANAAALEPSQVILVNKAHFRELVVRKPELGLHMLASMSLHLKHLVQSLHDIKGRQIEARLADWILKQSPAAAAGCPASVTLQISKKTLAGQLGVTSETLSRTFSRFTREGLIRVQGPKIVISDHRGLRGYVEA